jgi:sirohydrochlorin ferrochelatase
MTSAAEISALIVAHGSPSAPEGPERVLHALGDSVAELLPGGWAVHGATLAAPDAIETALGALPDGARLLVYPHFMADGWFSTEELPRRLRAAGAREFEVLPAFGLDPAVHRLSLGLGRSAVAGHPPGSVGLLLAAHGSPTDPRAAASARAAAGFLEASGAFREVAVGFVDESPFLRDAARMTAPAACLPYFAGKAGHVESDVPEALAEAGFPGPLLDPVGTAPEVPAIIAAALTRMAAKRAG